MQPPLHIQLQITVLSKLMVKKIASSVLSYQHLKLSFKRNESQGNDLFFKKLKSW